MVLGMIKRMFGVAESRDAAQRQANQSRLDTVNRRLRGINKQLRKAGLTGEQIQRGQVVAQRAKALKQHEAVSNPEAAGKKAKPKPKQKVVPIKSK